MDKLKDKIRELAEAVGLEVVEDDELKKPAMERICDAINADIAAVSRTAHGYDGCDCNLCAGKIKNGTQLAADMEKLLSVIMAAPDLLEAAKAIMDNCHTYYSAGSTERGHFRLSVEDKLKLREAVAKAEGKE